MSDEVEGRGHEGRTRTGPAFGGLLAAAVLAGVLALPGAAAAQHGGDFLFERPTMRFGVRTGYAIPRAGSQIFDFTTRRLTVDEDDFESFALSGELAFRANERLDVAVEVGVSRAEIFSEFRDYVGTDDLPIQQTTEFTRVPVTLNVRGYLFERGRSVSRYAWVPGGWSPYLGAGVGWISYEFSQDGEFVDFETLDIFRDRFVSDGTAPTVHVMGGIDVSLGRRLVLSGEGRYGWAEEEMDGDFVGFDEIDLSGFQATVGISVRF